MLSLLSCTALRSRIPCHILAHRVTDFHIARGLAFMQVVHTDTACTKITQRLCADVLYFHTVRTFLRRASCRHELSHNAGDRFPFDNGGLPRRRIAFSRTALRSHEMCHALTHCVMLSCTVPRSHALCHALTHRATFSCTALCSHAPRYALMHRATFSCTVPCSYAPCYVLMHRAMLSCTALRSRIPCHVLTKCVTDFHVVGGFAGQLARRFHAA